MKVGRAARLISGVGFPHQFQGKTSGRHPFLKVSDLNSAASGYRQVSAKNWVSQDDLASLGARLAPKGAIVFPKVGAAMLKNPRRLLDLSAAMDNNLLAIVPALGEPRFWLYALSVIDLGEIAAGGALPYVNEGQVRDLRIPFPGTEEQRRIADFLDAENARIDKLLDTGSRLQKILQERRDVQQSLLLRGNNRPGGRTFHPILGDLPDSWPIVPLKRLVPRIGVGVVVDPSSYFSKEGVPFLRGSNITDTGIDLTDVRRMSESNSRALWRSRLETGDVVVIRAGYPGRAAVIPKELNGANCASLIIIKKGDQLLPEYLEAYFNSPLGKAYVNSARYGAAQEQINVSHVVDFMVPVPVTEEQSALVAELAQARSSVRTLHERVIHQKTLLEERRQALITAAVTGQFDVSTASGRNVTEGVSV
nr:restriction endonuclease subunit S [Streptomyces phaeoluteigriseus]